MNSYQLILLAMTGLEAAVKLVVGLTTAAKQRSELTAEQEAELRAKQRQLLQQAHWQIEPDPQ